MNKSEMHIGIVGTGFGKVIAASIKALYPQANITIASCQSKDSAQAVAFALGCHHEDHWQDLVTHRYDALFIAAPNHLHLPIFKAATQHQHTIILEKPAALTLADIDQLISLEQTHKLNAIVDHELRFNPVISHIKK